MNTLIKLSNTHYIIVDDSEIKSNSFYVNNKVIFLSDSVYNEGNNPNNSNPKVTDYNYKITHSTQPLDREGTFINVKEISLIEVDKLINGYSVDEMALQYVIDESYLPTYKEECERAFINGFNTHKELTKDKLFTIEDMKKAFETGCAYTLGSYKDFQQIHPNKTEFIQSILPKTEWNVEFDENNNLKLV